MLKHSDNIFCPLTLFPVVAVFCMPVIYGTLIVTRFISSIFEGVCRWGSYFQFANYISHVNDCATYNILFLLFERVELWEET